MKELLELASCADTYAHELGVAPSIHLDDHIFNFLINNNSFDSVRNAVRYYFYDGRTSANNLFNILSQLRDTKPPTTPEHATMLEFASGYGCVTRHLAKVFPDIHITACDIHREAVHFIETKIGASAIESRTDPDQFMSEYSFFKFNIVFALSFFSHMPRATWGRWLSALFSLVLPGGVFVFTTQGPGSTKFFGNPAIPEDGFLFIPESEQKDLPVSEYGQTLVSRKFVIDEISRLPHVKSYQVHEANWWAHQDCYVVIKE